jgi:hypothetical protein
MNRKYVTYLMVISEKELLSGYERISNLLKPTQQTVGNSSGGLTRLNGIISLVEDVSRIVIELFVTRPT